VSFASHEYLLLLLVVVLAALVLPWRPRLLLLLAGSYVFYCWDVPRYGLVLLTSTLVDYVSALAMERSVARRTRRAWLLASLSANLGLLAYFKYGGFAAEGVRALLAPLGISAGTLQVALPVGISFYTFQSLSYTIDVYRGRMKAARDLSLFATYVAFFPQLVAGPIERAERLMPQLATKPRVGWADVWDGLCLILVGLVKKLVVADRLTLVLGAAFADPRARDGWELLLALLLMPIALYFDFGGYTDIARGSARLLGISLSRNFDYPFSALTPSDFWGRWHMTLTGWVRDYVFRPLGGVRRSAPWRTAANTVVAMTLVGLWHGAAWTFVLWGLWHGVLLSLEMVARTRLRLPREPRSRGLALLLWIPNYALLVLPMPLFFCRGLGAAVVYWSRLFSEPWTSLGTPYLTLLAAFWGLVMLVQAAGRIFDLGHAWDVLPAPLQGAAAAALLYLLLFGAVPTVQKFVYYQF
jgi:alginate O-acetyltransferase complex protein AlgI